ncbi:16S rRNA (guanine(527)-N(7))-methyltransferase RsmG [Candidatus Peregrinibacteria bacterium CG10_big_fil_rev_8_21_14_0_10_49_10]|nr:MAG: 16S rRNA (guanine(527)-N(7))-methyltransferase RsmG [Candidatus Peregrinibacteria bacterium CG10_big_fil_rev_8_21_14_0_10_49_10]
MLDESTQKHLRELMRLFLEENTKLNLSALRTEDECWNGNVLDSVGNGVLLPLEKTSIPQPLPPEEEGELIERTKKCKPRNTLFFAREMRKDPTDAELFLWEHIRHNQLGVQFRRQFIYEGSIFDFYCPELRLAIEVDGGIHLSKDQRKEDKERDAFFREEHQIETLRFTNQEVEENISNALSRIEQYIHKHSPPPLEEGLGVEVHKNNRHQTLLDLGTGGGFPLLPLAMCHPEIQCTGMDSTQKKIDAVQRIVDGLGLQNVSLLCGRAEELGRDPQHREQYDIVTVRGVAPFNVLLEYASPFAKPKGHILCWKSMKVEQELQDALPASTELSCRLVEHIPYTLPGKWGMRQIVVFEKQGPLSKTYPRKTGVPKKNPLL